MGKILIITGSTRPGRFNVQPANWINEIASKRDDAEYELIDIADFNLPLLDEPTPPMMRQYTKDHTKNWSKVIDEADGFIIVAPEYNHSVPGSLKNAIDFLHHEWNYKPVGFVSYGSAAGGARAVEHLRGIAGELKMYDVRDQVLISNYWNQLDEEGTFSATDEQTKSAEAMLEQVAFWANHMAPARDSLIQTA